MNRLIIEDDGYTAISVVNAKEAFASSSKSQNNGSYRALSISAGFKPTIIEIRKTKCPRSDAQVMTPMFAARMLRA